MFLAHQLIVITGVSGSGKSSLANLLAGLMNGSSLGTAAHSQGELRTEDLTLISHTHGRERRAERKILRRELQAA